MSRFTIGFIVASLTLTTYFGAAPFWRASDTILHTEHYGGPCGKEGEMGEYLDGWRAAASKLKADYT